ALAPIAGVARWSGGGDAVTVRTTPVAFTSPFALHAVGSCRDPVPAARRRSWRIITLAVERAVKERLQREGSLRPWSNGIVDRNRAQGVSHLPVAKTKRPLAPRSSAGPAPPKTPSGRVAAPTSVHRRRERAPRVAPHPMRKTTWLALVVGALAVLIGAL